MKNPLKTLAIITIILLVVVIAIQVMPRKIEMESEDGTTLTGRTGLFLKTGDSAN